MFKECFVVMETKLEDCVKSVKFIANPLAVFYSQEEAFKYARKFSNSENCKIEVVTSFIGVDFGDRDRNIIKFIDIEVGD